MLWKWGGNILVWLKSEHVVSQITEKWSLVPNWSPALAHRKSSVILKVLVSLVWAFSLNCSRHDTLFLPQPCSHQSFHVYAEALSTDSGRRNGQISSNYNFRPSAVDLLKGICVQLSEIIYFLFDLKKKQFSQFWNARIFLFVCFQTNSVFSPFLFQVSALIHKKLLRISYRTRAMTCKTAVSQVFE